MQKAANSYITECPECYAIPTEMKIHCIAAFLKFTACANMCVCVCLCVWQGAGGTAGRG